MCSAWGRHREHRAPGTAVTDAGGLPCGRWDRNWNPLGEQPVRLSVEPSLQPLKDDLFEVHICVHECVMEATCMQIPLEAKRRNHAPGTGLTVVMSYGEGAGN